MPPSRSTRTRENAPYHHGDLPHALVDAAVAILADVGPAGLTIAAAAKHVGVSHAAVYRHYADKHALLYAVAERGFAHLSAVLSEAIASAPEAPRQAFLHIGRAVVRFALKEPVLYSIMFSGVKTADIDDLTDAAEATPFGVLRGLVAEWQEEGLLRAGPPTPIALAIWATTHGLAMLVSSGQLAAPWRTLAEHVDAVHAKLLDGLSR